MTNRYEDKKILYLCDGKKPDCGGNNCYINGGCCKRTDDINHAIDFLDIGDYIYERSPDERLNNIYSLLLDLNREISNIVDKVVDSFGDDLIESIAIALTKKKRGDSCK